MREQVPARLRHLDDPWGLTWRLHNKVRSIDVARTLRQQRARTLVLRQERPIFVVGIPRSGTTAIYRVLASHPDLRSLGYEGHDCWRAFHHPRRHGWSSDWIGAGMVSRRERGFVARWWYARVGDGRFLDKTPDNALRIPYLLDLFPDAHIVWVKRNPLFVLNSLLAGWEQPLGRFRTYYLPEELSIPGHGHKRQWCFGLIDGWRDFRSAPIPRIVEEQFRQYNEGAMSGRRLVPTAQWHELFLEDVIKAPHDSITRLLEGLGLDSSPVVLTQAARLTHQAENTMSAEGPSNWRDREEVVLDLLERLRVEIAESGYDPDQLRDL